MYEIQRQWRCEFATESPTRLTVSRIHDKFEADRTVQDMYTQQFARLHPSLSGENSAVVL
jgi:hypothetical protein